MAITKKEFVYLGEDKKFYRKTTETKVTEKVREIPKPPPGTGISDKNGFASSWIPWTYEDIDLNDTVEIVPEKFFFVPTTKWEGKEYYRFDINDLKWDLEIGKAQQVPRYFAEQYFDMQKQHEDLQKKMQSGPESAPWRRLGYKGVNTWYHQPQVPTFGMDEHGRFLKGTSPRNTKWQARLRHLWRNRKFLLASLVNGYIQKKKNDRSNEDLRRKNKKFDQFMKEEYGK